MTINFENESSVDLGLELEEIASQVIEAALDYEESVSLSDGGCENLLITDNEQIHGVKIFSSGKLTDRQMYCRSL